MKLAIYLSGHGFGHATRTASVMESLHRAMPSARFHVRSMAPRRIVEQYCAAPFELVQTAIDVGAVESDVLHVDEAETLRRVVEMQRREEEIVAAEVGALRQFAPDAILFDLPPLAPVIAEAIGVPSIGLGNFTWSFIYEAFVAGDRGDVRRAVDRIRGQYAKTSLMLRLPLSHAMDEFPRVTDVPLVAKRSCADAAAVRAELGLAGDTRVVLIAMRGEEVPGLFNPAAAERGLVLLSFGEASHAGVMSLGESWQPRFVDLLAACDVVLSKPGYGVVSECIANGKPLLHLERGGFAESEVLVRGMTPYLRQRRLAVSELVAGGLGGAVGELLGQPPPGRSMPSNGAEVVARNIAGFLGRGGHGRNVP